MRRASTRWDEVERRGSCGAELAHDAHAPHRGAGVAGAVGRAHGDAHRGPPAAARRASARCARRVGLESSRRRVVRASATSVARAVRMRSDRRRRGPRAPAADEHPPAARTVHSSSQRTRIVTNAGAQRALARGGAQEGRGPARGGRAPAPACPARRRPAAGRRGRRPRTRRCREALDRAVERGDVHAPAAVLPEARDARARRQPRAHVAAPPGAGARAQMPPEAVVAVDVVAGEVGQRRVAHDVAAGDRAPAGGVRVLDDREGEARRAPRGRVARRRCAGPRTASSRSSRRARAARGAGAKSISS